MSEILAHIATNTDSSKNPGNSVLSECARTIMRIEANEQLRVIGINILGKFLTNKENNVRNVALNQLKEVVDIDYNAVQKHKQTITECLKDHDLQIKKQALDLIYAITNHSNVKSIVKELTNYLLSSDTEFKKELANKICQICEKYAPNKKWHVDTVVKVLTLSDGLCREEYISQIITIIATTPELHTYSVTKVYFALKENLNQIGLVQLGVWLVGEFGEMLVNGTCKNPDGNPLIVADSEIIGVMEQIFRDHNKKGERSDIIIMWTLTAISKLSIRIGQTNPMDAQDSVQQIGARIKKLLVSNQNHMNVEIQQRACEFLQILEPAWDVERSTIFEPMPFKGDENMLVDARDRAALDADEGDNQLLMGFDSQPTTSTANNTGGLLELDMMFGGTTSPNPVTNPPQTNPMADMMDLFGGGPAAANTSMPHSTNSNDIGDLFGGGSSSMPSNDIFGGDLLGGSAPSFPSFIAYEDASICIGFETKREGGPNFLITSHFKNKSGSQLLGINLQVAAQKYMTLKMKPASGTSLNAFAQDLTQQMSVSNTMDG